LSELAALLSRLRAEGFRVELRGDRIAVIPKARVTQDLRDAILSHRGEILELLHLHGLRLLELFHDAPTWPPSHGRAGPAAHVWGLVGRPVGLADGREGYLRFAEYDTGTGRVRCRVDLENGWALVDPEDLRPVQVGQRTREVSVMTAEQRKEQRKSAWTLGGSYEEQTATLHPGFAGRLSRSQHRP
jgi:hypothetical protein